MTRPTFSLIAEERPEALIPLHKMPGASPLPTGSGGGGGGLTMVVEGDVYGIEKLDDHVLSLLNTASRRGIRPQE